MKLTLSRRIGLLVGIVVLFVSISIGTFSFIYSSNQLMASQEEGMTAVAVEAAQRVGIFLESDLKVLEELARQNTTKSMNWSLQQPALKEEVETLGYLDLAIVTPQGMATYVVSGENADLSDRSYIKLALEGTANVSDVLISKVTGEPVVIYAVPIYDKDVIVGTLMGRRDGTSLSQITDQIGLGERGYAFIVGSDSTFYSHPNKDLVLNQVNAYQEIDTDGDLKNFGIALKELGTGTSGLLKYPYGSENRLTAMEPIPGTTWSLGVGNYESDILAPMDALRTVMVIVIVVVLIIGLIAGGIVGMQIANPITRLAAIIDAISKYDLTSKEDKSYKKILKRKDEIGAIAVAASNMKNNLLELAVSIAEDSQQVAASSESLTLTTSQSAIAANEVAKVIDEISKGALDQAKETELGVENIHTLNILLNEEQEYLDQLNSSANQVIQLKNLGLEAVRDLEEKNKDTGDAAANISHIITETDKSAEKISAASKMIGNIAGQTNLLALNAAIEAARAGEAGKGFAVVADEIRDLAEQSSRFTREIDLIIQDLSQKTGTAVKAMENVGAIMESQNHSVKNTDDKFTGISDAIESMKSIIENMNGSSITMKKKQEEITQIMESLSAISEENAAGTEEAAASVEEQTASMDEISSSSHSLSELAEDLKKQISKFKY